MPKRQNAACLAAICDLELRFTATTRGRGAMKEIAPLKWCDFAFAFGRPLRGAPDAGPFETRFPQRCHINLSVLSNRVQMAS